MGTHTIELVREAREVANTTVHHNIDTFQARGIFTGRCVQPKLINVPRERLEFLFERRFNSPQIAALLGVITRTVEKRLREYNLDTYTALICEELNRRLNRNSSGSRGIFNLGRPHRPVKILLTT